MSAKGGIGKTTIVCEVAKFLSEKKFRVCVVDFYFGMNDCALRFDNSFSYDLKEYIIGRAGTINVLNKYNNYLFYVKTNNSLFDYVRHASLIKFFITEIANEFDFVFFDVNTFNERILMLALESSTETMIVVNDNEIAVRNSDKIIQKIKCFKNICSQKVIMNMAHEIASNKGKCISKSEIEKLLKCEILFTIPKFYKNNYFGGKRLKDLKRKIISKLSYAIITNKTTKNGIELRYKGLFGILRKIRYAKYE